MALTDKIGAIADAIREKTEDEAYLTLDDMPKEIKKITSSARPGRDIAPAANAYSIAKKFSAIGNAIRYKTGGTAALTLDEMPAAIRSIAFKISEGLKIVTTPGSAYQTYDIAGIGTCADTDIIIPRFYGSTVSSRPIINIQQNAFLGNTKITSLIIPCASVVDTIRVGAYSFKNCTSLTSIALGDATNIYDGAFTNCVNLKNVDLGSGLQSIGRSAFEGCSSLTSVVIPETVTTIDALAFYNCKNLIFEVDSDNSTYRVANNCLIADSTLVCAGYKNASIPTDGSVKYISNAYQDRLELTSITVPESVLGLNRTFNGCKNLQSVTLPNSLVSINLGTFEDCDSLTTITVPAAVETVGDYAFGYCSKLKTITFKGTPTTIGDYAFSGSNALTDIYVPWDSSEGPGGYWWRNTNATIHYNHTA